MGGYSVTDPTYQALSSSDDDPRAMLRKIISPTSAAELVGPPPDSPPPHQPGQSTPLTGTLSQASARICCKKLGHRSRTAILQHPTAVTHWRLGNRRV